MKIDERHLKSAAARLQWASIRPRLAAIKAMAPLDVREAAPPFDLELRFGPPARRRRLLLAFRSRLYPREARALARELRTSGNAAVVCPALSDSVIDACRSEGVGALSPAGNAYLALDGIHYEVRGAASPREVPDSVNWLADAPSILGRILLENPSVELAGKDLAAEAGVSAASVTALRKKLAAQDWLDPEAGGIRLLRPEAMIRAMGDAERQRSVRRLRCFTPLPPPEFERAARRALKDTAFAFTEFAAAARLAPYVRSGRTTLWCADPGRLLAALGSARLVPAEGNANVHLLALSGTIPLHAAKPLGGMPLVSPVQLYFDLLRAGERGEEGAEHLLSEVLRKRWMPAKRN